MFNGCTNLTTVDFVNFDTSKATHMWYMFQKSKFDKDLNKWKINKDCLMSDMFNLCPIEDKNKLPKWYHEEKKINLG